MNTDRDTAVEYLREQRSSLRVITEEGAFDRNSVPGAPFVVVADSKGVILAAGAVNTLEQIEHVIMGAESLDREPGIIEKPSV